MGFGFVFLRAKTETKRIKIESNRIESNRRNRKSAFERSKTRENKQSSKTRRKKKENKTERQKKLSLWGRWQQQLQQQ